MTVLGGTPRSERDRLAFMSHAPMLYDELTGVENLRYFASLYGIDAPKANRRFAMSGLILSFRGELVSIHKECGNAHRWHGF